MYLDLNKLNRNYRILLYGYGNPGRKDDGLGPALIDMVEKWIIQERIKNVDVDSNYQLNIEDAYALRDYEKVIFIDASTEDIEDYIVTRVRPSDKVNFSMHSVCPSFILHLCQRLYGYSPETYLIHIKGYAFELQEGFSMQANRNLRRAYKYLQSVLSGTGSLAITTDFAIS